MKKVVGNIGVCAFALATGFGVALAATPDSIQIGIQIRDFMPNHSDFENFDRVRATRTCAGYSENPNALNSIPANIICEDGYPCGSLRANGLVAKQAVYGEWSTASGRVRGFRHELEENGTIAVGAAEVWEEPIYVTTGMVNSTLYVPVVDGVQDWENAYPLKATDQCDNFNFAQWFVTTPGVNKVVYENMVLHRVGTSTTYMINSGDGEMKAYGGYFPLDKYQAFSSIVPSSGFNQANPYDNYGKQSYKMWCPPTKTGDAGTDLDLCKIWVANNMDPTTLKFNPATAINASHEKARNYAFTIAGHAQFTYNAGDVFEFSGDDDMWIFVDGYLVADLGGVHNPAPARIVMDQLAAIGSWTVGSQHQLNFYYADRQTDGSNLRITTTLAEIVPSPYGQPSILKAERTGSSLDDFKLYVYLAAELSDATIANLNAGAITNPILERHRVSDPVTGAISVIERVFPLTSITYIGKDSDGAKYEVNWNRADTSYIPAIGDSLAFNYTNDDNSLAIPEGQPQILSKFGKAIVTYVYGRIVASSAPQEAIPIDPVNTSPQSLPWVTTEVEAAVQSGQIGGVAVNSAGSGSGEVKPVTSTGEILLTSYPASGLSDSASYYYGIPSANTDGYFHMVDPTVANSSGGYSFVKGLGTTGIATIQPSLCESTIKDGKIIGNCLMVSFDTYQAFKVNVSVFDQVGQFVTRYTQEVSDDEFTQIQKSAGVDNTQLCPEGDGITSANAAALLNGKVKATVTLYPLSQTGRKIATGVYILKIDVVQKERSICRLVGGTALTDVKRFLRSHMEYKAGYMRSN